MTKGRKNVCQAFYSHKKHKFSKLICFNWSTSALKEFSCIHCDFKKKKKKISTDQFLCIFCWCGWSLTVWILCPVTTVTLDSPHPRFDPSFPQECDPIQGCCSAWGLLVCCYIQTVFPPSFTDSLYHHTHVSVNYCVSSLDWSLHHWSLKDSSYSVLSTNIGWLPAETKQM